MVMLRTVPFYFGNLVVDNYNKIIHICACLFIYCVIDLIVVLDMGAVVQELR